MRIIHNYNLKRGMQYLNCVPLLILQKGKHVIMKSLEDRVAELEKKVKRLSASLMQQQKNQTGVTSETDNSANKVDALTPYAETKQAYVGDTELVFVNIPDGNLSVFVKDTEGNYPNYTVERMWDKVTVLFDPLEYVTSVTISVIR